jgi:hypothetical protein
MRLETSSGPKLFDCFRCLPPNSGSKHRSQSIYTTRHIGASLFFYLREPAGAGSVRPGQPLRTRHRADWCLGAPALRLNCDDPVSIVPRPYR